MGRALGALACGFAVQHPAWLRGRLSGRFGHELARGRDCGTRLRLQMGTAPKKPCRPGRSAFPGGVLAFGAEQGLEAAAELAALIECDKLNRIF